MSHPRTIAITGVTGLVGHGIARYFLARGDRVVGTVRRAVTPSLPNFHTVTVDLTAPHAETIAPFFDDCDAVIHTAAIIPKGRASWTPEEILEIFAVNALGTRTVLEAATAARVPRCIIISGARLATRAPRATGEAMPYATSDPYSTSKLCAELMGCEFQNRGALRVTTLRISAPYGYLLSGHAVVPSFVRRCLAGQSLELWGTGTREQVFTFVDDIARACDLAFANAIDGTFTITSGETTTMRALAAAVLRVFPGTHSDIVYTGARDPGEGHAVHYPIDDARDRLRYIPSFNLDAGLAQIAKYLQAEDRCFAEERTPVRV